MFAVLCENKNEMRCIANGDDDERPEGLVHVWQYFFLENKEIRNEHKKKKERTSARDMLENETKEAEDDDRTMEPFKNLNWMLCGHESNTHHEIVSDYCYWVGRNCSSQRGAGH